MSEPLYRLMCKLGTEARQRLDDLLRAEGWGVELLHEAPQALWAQERIDHVGGALPGLLGELLGGPSEPGPLLEHHSTRTLRLLRGAARRGGDRVAPALLPRGRQPRDLPVQLRASEVEEPPGRSLPPDDEARPLLEHLSALRPGDALSLVGPAGAGKSTALQQCVQQLAEGEGRVPVLLDGQLWMRSEVGIVKQIVRNFCANEFDLDEIELDIDRRIQRGELLLILDDPAPLGQTPEVVQKLRALREALPRVPLVVSGRRSSLARACEVLRQEHRLLALHGLSHREQRLIGEWFTEPGEMSGSHHPSATVDRGREDLLSNPLSLTIRLISRESTHGEGLRWIIRHLLNGRDLQGSGERPRMDEPERSERVLEDLALQLLREGRGTRWSRGGLVEALEGVPDARWVRAQFGDLTGFVEALEHTAGLIVSRGEERAFLHDSFLEHLAAGALHRRGVDPLEEPRRIAASMGPWGVWPEVIAQLAERLPRDEAGALHRALLDLDEGAGLRSLAASEGVTDEQVVALLMDGRPREGWKRREESLRARLSYLLGLKARVGSADRWRALLYRFIVGAPPVDLAMAWLALEQGGEDLQEARAEFFETAGRPMRACDFDGVPVPPQAPVARLARAPTTLAEYRRFDPEHGGDRDDPDAPVVNLCWFDAFIYCVWLGAELPDVGLWQQAARAGAPGRYWWGDAWEDGRSWHRHRPEVIQRCSPRPSRDEHHDNPWGLRDMAGNVWEWCAGGGLRTKPVCGGSWRSLLSALELDQVALVDPFASREDLGVRPMRRLRT